MFKGILAAFLTISSASAFAHSDFKYTQKADPRFGPKYFQLTDITYKGVPILGVSPEDELIQKMLWKARDAGFEKHDMQLITDADEAIQNANNFGNNYALLCEKLGFSSKDAGGGGQSLETLRISLPTKVASIRNAKLSIIELTENSKRVADVAVITGLGCYRK